MPILSKLVWKKHVPSKSLLLRPDIGITNPDYLCIGKSVYVGEQLILNTPHESNHANTSAVFADGSTIGRRTEISISPGDSFYLGKGAKLGSTCFVNGAVHIGAFASTGPCVYLTSGTSYTPPGKENWLRRDKDHWVASLPDSRKLQNAPIYIGEDALIGWGVYIKAGIYIGKGAYVGANAVVTRDIPPYSKQVGAPNCEIGQRLKFLPPKEIHAISEAHWPYFYEGFFMQQVDLEHSLKDQVAWMGPYAEIWLNRETEKNLTIVGRTLSDHPFPVKLNVAINGTPWYSTTIRENVFTLTVPNLDTQLTRVGSGNNPNILKHYLRVSLNINGSVRYPAVIQPALGIRSVAVT